MKVYIIIVSYNGLKNNWIAKCLASLAQSKMPLHVIVVDNKSSDGTQAFIKEKHPEVQLIEQSDNLGFGRANNVGIAQALDQGADYVFLFNQDAFVEEETLQRLVQAHQQHPEYGIISPIHFYYDGSELEYYFSTFMDIERTPKFYGDHIRGELKDIYESEFINAAAWLMPRQTLLDVGGFDPIFFHYGEDDNLCQRVRFHKYKVGVVPKANIYHDSKKRMDGYYAFDTPKYYLQYGQGIKARYANINIGIEGALNIELRSQFFNMLKGLFLLKPKLLKEGYKKWFILKRAFREIKESRAINVQKKAHYLNLKHI